MKDLCNSHLALEYILELSGGTQISENVTKHNMDDDDWFLMVLRVSSSGPQGFSRGPKGFPWGSHGIPKVDGIPYYLDLSEFMFGDFC